MSVISLLYMFVCVLSVSIPHAAIASVTPPGHIRLFCDVYMCRIQEDI